MKFSGVSHINSDQRTRCTPNKIRAGWVGSWKCQQADIFILIFSKKNVSGRGRSKKGNGSNCLLQSDRLIFSDLQVLTERGWSSLLSTTNWIMQLILRTYYSAFFYFCCTVLVWTQYSYFTCMVLVLWTCSQPFGTRQEALSILLAMLLLFVFFYPLSQVAWRV